MKKYIKYTLLFLATIVLASCSKEDIPMTSTVELAGEWTVTVDAVDASGNVIMEDPYGMGPIMVITYNTNANDGKEIWLDDLGNFWEFKVKVPCQVGARTFGSDSSLTDVNNGIGVTVKDGKVTVNGAKIPSTGTPTDAFECKVTFDDDDNGLIYWIHGYRRSGFAADE